MTGLRGPDFYDAPAVFELYLSKRRDPTSANETLEKPVLAELIGELRGLRILDLGCGDAGIGREALEAGCRKYVGVEGSRNMVRQARKILAGTPGVVHESWIEDWTFPAQSFDLVISRLVLHYVAEPEGIFERVYHSLVPGGRFIFSIEHPVITSSDRSSQAGGLRQEWIVDHYFETGIRQTRRMGADVIKYHRTIEDYFTGLRSAGFQIEAVRESRPQRAMFADEATYQRRLRIPLMLFFSSVRIMD